MATYIELRKLFNDGDLLNKIDVAIIVAANDLINGGTPTTADKAWAVMARLKPRSQSEIALKALLADNKSASVSTIQGSTDSTIQTVVDSVAPTLVDALAGV